MLTKRLSCNSIGVSLIARTTIPSTKYLGIHIAHDLTRSSHISNDANRMLGYLRPNPNLAPSTIELLAYETLVQPKLEFACAVWDSPQIHLYTLLKPVQNCVARLLFSDHSYHTSATHLKSKAKFPSLKTRHTVTRLSEYLSSFISRPDSHQLHQSPRKRHCSYTSGTAQSCRRGTFVWVF